MKKVYFYSCGVLNYIGNVRKDYNVNDVFRLQSMTCKLKVIDITDYATYKACKNKLYVAIA